MREKRLYVEEKSVRFWDISRGVDSSTYVYPGDTAFHQKWLSSGAVNTSEVRFTPHVGTHVDAPLHFGFAGGGIGQENLEVFVGPCFVVRVTGDVPTISEESVPEEAWHYRRILFATGSPTQGFDASLAEKCVCKGVLLVGIDTPSIDPQISTQFKAHRILLGNGIFILEGLDLERIHQGEYWLSAAPLKWKDTEASPVRAYLQRL